MNSNYKAEKVLVDSSEFATYWLAEEGKTAGQGFTIKVDKCRRRISGCQLMNLHSRHSWGGTKQFRVSGSVNESGPYETLLTEQLKKRLGKPGLLETFDFAQSVEVQFIKFELISYWNTGGALYYFNAVLGPRKYVG